MFTLYLAARPAFPYSRGSRSLAEAGCYAPSSLRADKYCGGCRLQAELDAQDLRGEGVGPETAQLAGAWQRRCDFIRAHPEMQGPDLLQRRQHPRGPGWLPGCLLST